MTASQVFHVPFDEVTDLQRRNAKAVNFGIVYGISSFGLSQDLSISRKEAAQYIEHYFESYPGIKTFLDKCVSDAKEKGYAETLYGRRRPMPELKSSNFMQRSFGERVAMNAPIQGTAADIIKIAMIHVNEELGGVGSGKSEILKFLEQEYGAVVCQMDEVAKQIQKKGTRAFTRIVQEFGEQIVGADGELDRMKLGSCVFADEKKLQRLNDIVHPEVLEWVRKDILKKKEECCSYYIAALLPEVGKELCDELWYIYTDEAVRRERLKSSRHYTDEKITRMIASQPVEEVFRKACTVVIDNSGDFEATKRQIGDRLNK